MSTYTNDKADVQHINQQPTGQVSMNVNGVNPKNVLDLPVDANGQRAWSNSLFDCFNDAGTCVLSCFCPCITYAKNKSRVQALDLSNRPHPQGGDGINGDCFGMCALMYCGVGCFLPMVNRGNIRKRYNVESSGLNDFLLSWCCSPCALTQEAQELELEENFLLGKEVARKA